VTYDAITDSETVTVTTICISTQALRPVRRFPAALLRPLVLLVSDASAFVLALSFAVLVIAYNYGGLTIAPYLDLLPFTFVLLASYWMSGLYSRPALSQPEDLERGTACSCCILLTFVAFALIMRDERQHFVQAVALCIVTNIILMPLLRELSRHLFSRAHGWGDQAVIFGAGPEAHALIEKSRRERDAVINPVAIVDPRASDEPFLCGLPITSSIESATKYIDRSMPVYGLLTAAAASSEEISRLVRSPESVIFSRIVLVSNASAMSSMWAIPLERRSSSRLNASSRVNGLTYRFAKRTIDLGLGVPLLLVSAPFVMLFAALIKLDSPGPVFFGHQRIGRNGRPFKAWKFRTMQADSSAILAKLLVEHAAVREEWERDHKLANDPRVTKMGRLLRVTSADELPQLWNVVRGDMSLVGPRPIVQEEVHRYGDEYAFFTRAHGGVTGMWQVSGRSSTTYGERVMLDSFYVQNWSIWLDLCILLRTFGAVVSRRGAL
jgi:Undecaprenyl-phosphate galactose phosphotransferase WbaP